MEWIEEKEWIDRKNEGETERIYKQEYENKKTERRIEKDDFIRGPALIT